MIEALGGLASMAPDEESIVALVKREAADEWERKRLSSLTFDPCVREAVDQYHGSHIMAFVPLLALRRVRSCIRAGTCECDDW